MAHQTGQRLAAGEQVQGEPGLRADASGDVERLAEGQAARLAAESSLAGEAVPLLAVLAAAGAAELLLSAVPGLDVEGAAVES